MIRTLLVILAVVAVVYFLVPRPSRVVQPAADVGGAVAAAGSGLGFTPLVPQGLPADWVPTEAGVRNGADGIKEFHIGYRVGTDVHDNAYAGVEQATSSTDHWLRVNDANGTKVGDVVIDGTTWEQLSRPERAYTSLLLRRPNQVILITSKNGGLAQAEVLARALHVPAS
jgi:hypothetical protein